MLQCSILPATPHSNPIEQPVIAAAAFPQRPSRAASDLHRPSGRATTRDHLETILRTDFLYTLRSEWLGNIRGDVLAGLVVALALIPEAIAFSIIAGVDPKVGLYASFSIAVITAIVGGRRHDFGGNRSHGRPDGHAGARSRS